jgi:hypothetical protein
VSCPRCELVGLPEGWPPHEAEQHILSGGTATLYSHSVLDPESAAEWEVVFDRPLPVPPLEPECVSQVDELEGFVDWLSSLGYRAVGMRRVKATA